jgi:hypothetical protein
LILACALPAHGWGGKTKLARKYRPGERLVYHTSIKTSAAIESNPPELKALLPPLPTTLSTRQQNTLIVRSVTREGVAEIENRFDRFEIESNLTEMLPEELQDTAQKAQEEFSQRLSGHSLIVRYDRSGRLLDIGAADSLLADLDAPLRETCRQLLRVFFEHIGGNALYPDHPVKKGEEWRRRLDAPPEEDYPFSVEGESTMRFVGKTRHQGTKAAIIDFRFTNVLKPSLESLRKAGPLAQLEAQGMGLDMRIDGQGQGRVLVALKDGRILRNDATLHQQLRAEVPNNGPARLPVAGPLKIQVDSNTEIRMEGKGESRR